MKLSSAAITVAAVSLFSSTHAAPLSFQNGEISGRLHHRRGSDVNEIPSITGASRASEALDDLDIGFEPGSHLILPRILNFIKRQVTSPEVGTNDASGQPTSEPETSTTNEATGTGTTDANVHTSLMQPDMEEYGFASESADSSLGLVSIKEVKE